jgi:hypothetical protein
MKINRILSTSLFCCLTAGALWTSQPLQAETRIASPDASSITLGIHQEPTLNFGDEINAVNTLTGKKHGIVMFYVNWANPFSSNNFLLDQIDRQMAAEDRPVVMLAWEPTEGRANLGCDRDYSGAIPPSSISNGACDRYIRAYAQQMKQRGSRFLIKFAHEMNNTSQPWSPPNFGLPPSAFIQMWRHVRDVFKAEAASNVEFVWAPIYQSWPNTPDNAPQAYYPGNDYVDWVGVSGFNYNLGVYGGWLTFSQIFDGVLRDFACRYPKPQIIHEMASAEGSGGGQTKAAWIADAYAQMPKYPRLRAVVWYNNPDSRGQADFRVTSSTRFDGGVGALPSGSGAWTNAYNAAIASGVYVKSLPSLAQATPLAAAPQSSVGINANMVPRARLPIISTGGSSIPGGGC